MKKKNNKFKWIKKLEVLNPINKLKRLYEKVTGKKATRKVVWVFIALWAFYHSLVGVSILLGGGLIVKEAYNVVIEFIGPVNNY